MKCSGSREVIMEFNGILVVSYIIATILFILALGGLSNQETARRGNWYGIVGMAIALVATIWGIVEWGVYVELIIALLIGGTIGLMSRSGGTMGIVKSLRRVIAGRRDTQVTTAAMGLAVSGRLAMVSSLPAAS